jgi:molybdopterin-guanine dinucleotide biosynthesis protein B
MAPPVVSIVSKKNSGKTTLIARLIPELRKRGYRVGTIKHDVHGFDIDHEGKDSWTHKRSGAQTVVISSPRQVAVIKDVEQEETLDVLVNKYFETEDIVIAEGYKMGNKPKIEVFRKAVHATPLLNEDIKVIAVVSDDPSVDLGVPCIFIDAISDLADFIEERFL